MKSIHGQFVDIFNHEIYPAEILFDPTGIQKISRLSKADEQYIMPGFIDAHVHVESSMLVPSEFARLAVVHGTVATISDPHEIGNVLGVEGVEYMIESGKKVNFKFYFGAPSCVPATIFETAGAEINVYDVEYLLSKPDVIYLAEMMNWPGVLSGDQQVLYKIAIAKKMNKPVDGHAPGLMGDQAKKYIDAGISTDHECFTAAEALNKLNHGMKILIREGSAAKNFNALIPLLDDYFQQMMFCSDDKHPDNLVEGHINLLVKRALREGNDLYKVLRAACWNPVSHYRMDVGLLREGDKSDFIVVDSLDDFKVIETWINGQKVAEKGKSLMQRSPIPVVNNFNTSLRIEQDFDVEIKGKTVRVMEALDGQLITNLKKYPTSLIQNDKQTNVDHDLLKIAVVNRYEDTQIAIGYIKNIGLKEGAIASSVGHDSHNIVVVGVDSKSMCEAVNLIIEQKGGVSAVGQDQKKILGLPVAGIMSDKDGYAVAREYSLIDRFAKDLGSNLNSPFMTLSFMALLVIPKAKMSDLGFFDGEKFEFVEVFSDQ